MTAPSEPVALLTAEQAKLLCDLLDTVARDYPRFADVNNPTPLGKALRAIASGAAVVVAAPQQPAPHSKSQAKRQALQRGESPRLGAQQPAQEAPLPPGYVPGRNRP